MQSKFIYPADKCFDKRVLKHVAKHFKQYKHGLKKDYFKPEQKTKEDMYELVPKGHSRDGWMRLVDYWCSKEHKVYISNNNYNYIIAYTLNVHICYFFPLTSGMITYSFSLY